MARNKNEAEFELPKGYNPLLPQKKQWYTCRQLAKMWNVSDQFIRNRVHSGELLAFCTKRSVFKELGENEEPKSYIKIPRYGAVLFEMSCLNYNDASFLRLLEDVLKSRNFYGLTCVKTLVERLLNDAQEK